MAPYAAGSRLLRRSAPRNDNPSLSLRAKRSNLVPIQTSRYRNGLPDLAALSGNRISMVSRWRPDGSPNESQGRYNGWITLDRRRYRAAEPGQEQAGVPNQKFLSTLGLDSNGAATKPF